VAQLEATLTARAAELLEARSQREAFRARYQSEVGRLHERLDELELAIAEAELGELTQRLDDEASKGARPATPDAETLAPAARFTSDAVRKLFRDVAKLIHPDLAGDDRTRDERHALMIEANRAYVLGDEAHLRWLLGTLEDGGSDGPASTPEAVGERLARRCAHLEAQLQRVEDDLAELQASPLWALKVMVDREAVRGRDIVRDMVRRLERDIMVATNRLEAMRPPPHAS